MRQPLKLGVAEVPKIAHRIAEQLRGGEILALVGPLGAGKTTFVQALGRELGVKKLITSPTFVLMQEYPAMLPATQQPVILYHLDLYRTAGFSDLAALGITDVWQKKDTVVAIEWADKIKSFLPKQARYIYLS